MLFIEVDGALKSLALATSHTLNLNMNTTDTSTKDNGNGRWQNLEAGLRSWDATSDNLVGDEVNGIDLNQVFDLFVAGKPVKVACGIPGNGALASAKPEEAFKVPGGGWTPSTKDYYQGDALITAMTINAANGEKATASVSLTGCGPLTKVGAGITTVSAASLSAPASGTPVASVPETAKTSGK